MLLAVEGFWDLFQGCQSLTPDICDNLGWQRPRRGLDSGRAARLARWGTGFVAANGPWGVLQAVGEGLGWDGGRQAGVPAAGQDMPGFICAAHGLA